MGNLLELGSQAWPISPSCLTKWMEDRSPEKQGWADHYLGQMRGVQTLPMAAGSAFDALIKAKIGGSEVSWDSIELEDKSAAQEAGLVCLRLYENCGAWTRLERMLQAATSYDVAVNRSVYCPTFDVWLRYKPDLVLWFGDSCESLDWKVNGYFSAASPAQGHKGHGAYMPVMHEGREVDGSGVLWSAKREWFVQLVIYNWAMLAERGRFVQDTVGHIDQLCFRNGVGRVAYHSSYLAGLQVADALKSLRAWRPSETILERMANLEAMGSDWRAML